MSRTGRSHTRLTYAASLTVGQAKIILGLYWKQCLLGAALCSLFTVILALCEPSKFQSQVLLKVKTFDISRSSAAEMLRDSDSASKKEIVDRQAQLASAKDFAEELSRLLLNDPERAKLKLNWGLGERFRMNLLLTRTGLGGMEIPPVNLEALRPEERAALVAAMTEIRPNYLENTIQVKVASTDPFTAKRISLLVGQSFVHASRQGEQREISDSLQFLHAQKGRLRERLIQAEDDLKNFFKENPLLASETARKSITEEATTIKEDLARKADELKSNERLLQFYKSKFSSFLSSSDTTTEVYDKFKQELVELKYQRKKFIFQGYSPEHEGIQEIDQKITNVEKVLASAGDISGRNVVSVGHEAQLSEKIVNLQDQIKKQQIEIDTLRGRQVSAEARTKTLPEQEMLYGDFQREVRLSREMFDEIARRVEVAELRAANGDGILSLASAEPHTSQVPNLPTGKRVVFAFIVGLLMAGAASFFWAVARKRIVDELSVHGMGFKFAGNLRPSNTEKAKLLLNLGCSYSQTMREKPSIILCSSPKGVSQVAQVLSLTDYLGKQKERSLFIIVGDAGIHNHFRLRTDLGYAKVYSSADGIQFVLQITDEETVHSIRECLALVEAHYKVKYSMIFLFIENGSECLVYPYGQKLADKMLLIGPSAQCSAGEYFHLVDGFEKLDEVYVALTQPRRGLWRKKRLSAEGQA
jgi:uncharacterized protein involved in exopolysaccharide biosynthesis